MPHQFKYNQTEPNKYFAEPPKNYKKKIKTQIHQTSDDQKYNYKITHYCSEDMTIE